MSVSVIIQAHNAALSLSDTLHSILAQTSPSWEAIVVNHGSTDHTARVIATFGGRDPRIRLVSQPAGCVSAARNRGIRFARHEWLLFLDADDLILPTFLERLTDRLSGDPCLDAVHCGWAGPTAVGGRRGHQICLDAPDLFTHSPSYQIAAMHACIVRKACVEAVGGFDTSLQIWEEFDLWQRIASTGAHFGTVPEVLATHRMPSNSAPTPGPDCLSMFYG